MVISNGLKHKDKIKSLTHNSKIHKHACPHHEKFIQTKQKPILRSTPIERK